MTLRPTAAPLECPCEAAYFSRRFRFDAPPQRETRYAFAAGSEYEREVWACALCRHHVSRHALKDADLYRGDYMTSTYGDDGIKRAFERIVALDPAASDNVARVRRVDAFARARLAPMPLSVLDVGSGLCVFLHGMNAAGWSCTALDPDPHAVRHARDTVGVEAIEGDIRELRVTARFSLITLNKVLEHVEHPVAVLRHAGSFLAQGGLVYLEVPDAEVAAAHGQDREEFTIDHPHIFSTASLSLMASRAGFRPLIAERIHEPSDKYTLYAFVEAT